MRVSDYSEPNQCLAWRLVHEHRMPSHLVVKRLGLGSTGELLDLLAAETARRRAADFLCAKTAGEGSNIPGGWRGMSGLEKSDMNKRYIQGWKMRQAGYSQDAIAERCGLSRDEAAHMGIRIRKRGLLAAGA